MLVDVSPEEDYADGHPPSAVNVPFMNVTRKGRVANADFLPVFEAVYPKDTKLVISAASANDAERAVELLRGAGYTDLSLAGNPPRSETITEDGSYPEMRWKAGLG
jgi:rhodanese-related sulfurtransferase